MIPFSSPPIKTLSRVTVVSAMVLLGALGNAAHHKAVSRAAENKPSVVSDAKHPIIYRKSTLFTFNHLPVVYPPALGALPVEALEKGLQRGLSFLGDIIVLTGGKPSCVGYALGTASRGMVERLGCAGNTQKESATCAGARRPVRKPVSLACIVWTLNGGRPGRIRSTSTRVTTRNWTRCGPKSFSAQSIISMKRLKSSRAVCCSRWKRYTVRRHLLTLRRTMSRRGSRKQPNDTTDSERGTFPRGLKVQQGALGHNGRALLFSCQGGIIQ